jgi:DNA-directed RNA polymerase specialized sigma24 family protein
MKSSSQKEKPGRDHLSKTILETLRSWPELDRRIFTSVHYGSLSVDEAARIEGIEPRMARSILDSCQRDLVERLRDFRRPSSCGCRTDRHEPEFAVC